MSEAAEILYLILNDLRILGDRVPILIVCNKQDLQFAKKAAQIEHELEAEVEEHRKVKSKTLEEGQALGYLESLKKKFSF